MKEGTAPLAAAKVTKVQNYTGGTVQGHIVGANNWGLPADDDQYRVSVDVHAVFRNSGKSKPAGVGIPNQVYINLYEVLHDYLLSPTYTWK